jgi:hypothetical protein
MAANSGAVQVPLTLVQSQSFLSLDGNYAGNPFKAQDDPEFPTFPPNDPGNTVEDYDPAHPSNRTTLTGSILVEVDNVLAPTTIQILSANMDATVTGEWLPEPQPPGGATSEGTIPAPAAPADIGIKIIADFGLPGCCDIAYATLRDVSYDLVTQTIDTDGGGPITPTPVIEPVNAQGEFSSLSQFLSYRSGYFDYWADPTLLNERARDENTGDGGQNQHDTDQTTSPDTFTPIPNAPKSTYIVSGSVATLTIPVEINIFDDLSQFVTGQLVATFEIGSDGDHNGDGTVNAADYVPWRKLPANYGGDPDGYNDWYEQFGEPGAGSSGSGGVPEPSAAVLFVVGLSALLLGRRRQGR